MSYLQPFYLLLLFVVSSPYTAYSQQSQDATDALQTILANYEQAKAIKVDVAVQLYNGSQELSAAGFTCRSLSAGEDMRLNIRDMVLIEQDTLRLQVDLAQQQIELGRKVATTSPSKVSATDWTNEIQENLEAFIAASTFEETADYYLYRNELDHDYDRTEYYFGKSDKLLHQVIYHLPADNTMGYDRVEISYDTKILTQASSLDMGLATFVAFGPAGFYIQPDYADFTFSNQLDTKK